MHLTNFGLELFRSGLLLLTSYQKEEKNAKNSKNLMEENVKNSRGRLA